MDLKQLSQVLGLSQTTISRALNGYADVSERTRERVMAAAREHGYRPNGAARRLAVGRSEAMGIVYPTGSGDLGDPRFLAMVGGLTDRCAARNIDVLIASSPPEGELATYERLLRNGRVDGYIVPHTRRSDPRIDYLRTRRVPFVAYGRCDDCQDIAWFDFDNEAGMALAVAQLLRAGHQDIALVHAPTSLNFAHQRLLGYQRGLQAAGLPPQPQRVVPAEFTRVGGYQAAQTLMQSARPPTAIVADNHVLGVGLVRGLLDLGLRLPEDVSVIVYDGIPADSPLHSLGVNAIEQPDAASAGHCLADLLQGLTEGRPVDALQVLWQPVYAPGRTVGPPRGA
ncbi:LacI family DNA-binding transcriptional regulator [Ideonella livida]|uniref:LacI family transcriptional regulator n=1 Tax=Ideonella livida TaxID=2707176 RepID=A0A7C9PH77_9BURK|nr:substrate-binding domain-containing protein [Ideonella livida]NDY91853.1 LacI family transcriptional regulator [Ideonella livida]